MNSTKIALVLGLMVAALIVAIPGTSLAGSCTENSYKQCISNIVYWYDSCGAVQSIAQNCNLTGQICQNAQCVNKVAPTPTPTPTPNPTPNPNPNPNPTPNGTNHYSTACYNNNLYWYNQQGMVQDLFKSCNDNNSCTQDSCGVNQCVNTLKCDGSTCNTNSADYATYCGTSQNPGSQNPGGSTSTTSNGLMVATFVKKESETLTWSKALSAANNDKLTFLTVVKNASGTTINNVTLKTDLTSSIAYTGGLKVNNIDTAGNLASGITIGSLGAKEAKIITFAGSVQSATAMPIVTITSTLTTTDNPNLQDSDTITVNVPVTTGGTISNNTTTDSGTFSFIDFIKRWYMWIIITIILAILFVVIFRRLSSSI